MEDTSPTLATPVPAARRYEADAMMLFAVVIWAFNFTVIKLALSSFAPLAFTAVRFALAMVTMLILLRLRGETLAVNRRDLVGIIIVGLVGHPLYQWLFINGLALTSPGNASLLLGVAPIFVALYGQVSGAERASPIVWGGVLTTFLGMVLVIAGRTGGLQLGSNGATGDLLVLVERGALGVLHCRLESLRAALLTAQGDHARHGGWSAGSHFDEHSRLAATGLGGDPARALGLGAVFVGPGSRGGLHPMGHQPAPELATRGRLSTRI